MIWITHRYTPTWRSIPPTAPAVTRRTITTRVARGSWRMLADIHAVTLVCLASRRARYALTKVSKWRPIMSSFYVNPGNLLACMLPFWKGKGTKAFSLSVKGTLWGTSTGLFQGHQGNDPGAGRQLPSLPRWSIRPELPTFTDGVWNLFEGFFFPNNIECPETGLCLFTSPDYDESHLCQSKVPQLWCKKTSRRAW